jgi:hypothetical protein
VRDAAKVRAGDKLDVQCEGHGQNVLRAKPEVCDLLCSSQRANRPPKAHEVLLSFDGQLLFRIPMTSEPHRFFRALNR